MLMTLGSYLSPRAQARPRIPAAPGLYSAILDGDSLSSTQIWSVTSTDHQRRCVGYFVHAAAQLYQLFDTRYAQGYGTSGHKIADMLADQATPLAYCAANSIHAVFLMLGANDVEDTTRAVSALTVDYDAFISAYANLIHRPYVFVGLPTPRGDWEADPEVTRATYVQRLHDIRNAITAVVSTFGTRVILFDAWDDLVDPAVTNVTAGLTYYPLADRMQADGIHLSMIGAHYVGKACAAAVKTTPLWTPPIELPDTAGAYNLNPGMSGTSGSVSTGASGVVADNCRVQRANGSNLALTCSKATREIFGISQECQKIVLSGATVAGEEGYFYLEYPEPNVAFDGTQGLDIIVPIRIENPVGMTGVYIYGRVDMDGTTYNTREMAYISNNFLPSGDGTLEWLLQTEPLVIPAGTSTRHQILVRMSVDGTVSGSGATIYIGQCIVRKRTA